MSKLLDLLGGRQALGKAVGLFYAKVLLDPALSQYFRGVDPDFISRHFLNVIEACYGEDRSLSKDYFSLLTSAHGNLVSKMGLNDADYNRMLEILASILDELQLSTELKTEMLDLAEYFRAAVLARGPQPAASDSVVSGASGK